MSFKRLLEKVGGKKSFQDNLLYFLTWFYYHFHIISADSSKCAYFTGSRQNYGGEIHEALMFSPLCFLGSHLHSLPTSFSPPNLAPVPCPKHFLNNFKDIFSAKCRPAWSTDPHSWITLLHLSGKDLTWENGSERVKLSCGEIRLTEVVSLLQCGCTSRSLADSKCAPTFLFSFSFFLLLHFFLMEYSCSTLLCQFMVYSKVNQPYI